MLYPTMKEIEKEENKKEFKINFTEELLKSLDVENYMTIIPSNEINILNHYKSMSNVEIEPGIEDFWNNQEQKISENSIKDLKSEYRSRFYECEHARETLKEKEIEENKANNFSTRLKKADHDIEKAKVALRKAQLSASTKQANTDPFKEIFQLIVNDGQSEELNKVKEARASVIEHKKSLDDCKRNRRELLEAKEKFEYSKNKLTFKEKNALAKMAEISYKIQKRQENVAIINKQNMEISKRYHKQFEIIDKYNAITNFQNSSENKALKANNPVLYKKIIALQKAKPKFIIKLNGNIEIKINEKSVSTVYSQIEEEKLSSTISTDITNVDTSLSALTNEENNSKNSISDNYKLALTNTSKVRLALKKQSERKNTPQIEYER